MMRKTALLVLASVLVIALGVTAQCKMSGGPKGQCGTGQAGPGMCANGGGMGQGMGMGMGGWWMRVQPQTPQQKQLVNEVAGLHNRIRAEQAELRNLKATNSNPSRAAALENDLAALRTRMYNVMQANQALLQQMGVSNACAMGAGTCPVGMQQKCMQGQTCPMDPAKCATCPNKGQCPQMNSAQCADCPNKDKCLANQASGCPMANQGPACEKPCAVPQSR